MGLLALLKKNNFSIAVASSSVMNHIEMIISGLKIQSYFQVVVSGQFVKRGKPYPDINLEAARQLHVKPEDCLVLDDAQSGVESAKRGNMKIIAVPNKFTINQTFSSADLIVDSLDKIDLDLILSVS